MEEELIKEILDLNQQLEALNQLLKLEGIIKNNVKVITEVTE